MIGLFKNPEYEKLNIFCNQEVKESIEKLYTSVFPIPFVKLIEDNINIYTLKDGETLKIAGKEITFFDTYPTGSQLYGFETVLSNGKRLVFLGDETCNPVLYDRIKDADYVIHDKVADVLPKIFN